MRILASFFLFALAIHSSSLLAAKQGLDPDAQATTLKLSQAKNWKQLLAETRDLLPGNVVKEMETAAKGLDYPDVRLHRGEMILSEPNGGRLNILLDKEGKVFFNGEEWEIRPLATTQAEVDRIVAFIFDSRAKKRRRSMLEIVLPFAHADDGSSSASGMALAAQMKAMIHKARACGGDNLTEAQSSECAQMAVGMKQEASLPMNPPRKISAEEMLPITLSCPRKKGDGVIEEIRKNKQGLRSKIRITYVSGKPTKVHPFMGLARSDFMDLGEVNLKSEEDSTVREGAMEHVTAFKGLKKICEASSAEKRRYFASLEENKALLDEPQNANFSEPAGQKTEVQEAI